MIIKRYFIRKLYDEGGWFGWLPLWVPASANFDPGDLPSMLHDTLEHRLCDSGLLHEECMAFGRLYASRNNPPTPGELGSEFYDVLERAECNLEAAPPVSMKADTAALAEGFAQGFSDAFERDDRSDEPKSPSSVTVESLKRWFAIGYLDGKRRYPQKLIGHLVEEVRGHHSYMREVFEQETQRVSEDDCLRLTVDTDTCEVSWKTLPCRENGYPRWLQDKVSWHSTH